VKILFLTLRSPYPPQRGDKIRSFNFIRYLSKKGYEVDLVCFAENERDLDHIRPLKRFCNDIKMLPLSRKKAILRAALRMPTRLPLQNGYWFAKEISSLVRSMIKRNRYDLLHAQLFRLGQYLLEYDRPKVIDLTDAMALNLLRRTKLDRSILLPLLEIERRRVRKYEVEIAKLFDASIVSSEVDRNYLLAQSPDLNLNVIPTSVDLDYFRPAYTDPEPVILFTGTMGYFPNDDAAIFFHDSILPTVKREIPDAKLYIVGNNPPPKVRALESTGDTVVTGHVEDVRPYFRMASVFVCPLRSGSGIQTKNLEAMAMGLPIVTTPFGLEGIDAVPGRDMIVASDVQTFTTKVIEMMRNKSFRERIGRNGRKLVESKYSWQVVGRKLELIYKGILGR
jgi:sugar transferase (PEP-CTERM/EpsH1 system associated)